ncbi:MAG: hypothetical protein KJZ80_01365 [Hyphomicrobiaceae bacterium]|nr:hypothetical protein [Hyphomicrobiaceae bacterium]
MLKLTTALAAGAGAAVLVLGAASPALAKACINKAGQGTNTTEDGAKFQAYEAILQATDWGMWASWMATSQKIGVAPGYAVTRVRFKCQKGAGLGSTCIGQATLCK